ncbi:uncharacterized protein LOC129737892 [Uranotaenia lowii]|uniref:uncharacterized protein LOC129737892 n=1 Tax=Uranotaenia lowii TaxID=190385 RepID=UPI002479A28F|nr:uncharacterized protein LOC129737892 [Uranotaenia lowii]
MCSKPDSLDNLVGCDNCSAWAHYDCAGVSSSIEATDRSWKCSKCQPQNPDKTKGTLSHEKASSKVGSRSSQRSIRVNTELLRLEEEKAMALKALEEEEQFQQDRRKKYLKKKKEIATAYLDRKYDVLLRESEGSSKGGSISGHSREKVESWLGINTAGRRTDRIPEWEFPPIVEASKPPMHDDQNVSSQNTYTAICNDTPRDAQLPASSTSTPQSNQPFSKQTGVLSPGILGGLATLQISPTEAQIYLASRLVPRVSVPNSFASKSSEVTTAEFTRIGPTAVQYSGPSSTVTTEASKVGPPSKRIMDDRAILSTIIEERSGLQSNNTSSLLNISALNAMPQVSVPSEIITHIGSSVLNNNRTPSKSIPQACIHVPTPLTTMTTDYVTGNKVPGFMPMGPRPLATKEVEYPRLEVRQANENTLGYPYVTCIPVNRSSHASSQVYSSLYKSSCPNPNEVTWMVDPRNAAPIPSSFINPAGPNIPFDLNCQVDEVGTNTQQLHESFECPVPVEVEKRNNQSKGFTPNLAQKEGIFEPSKGQLAARQVMAKDLPNFSGNPQEWPLFFVTFRNTTVSCGFNDAENLARLQRCLTGEAREAVSSSLLSPDLVPEIIETLHMLYGKPEILLHSIIQKLRATPPPKEDNLRSIINFGLAVKNTVNHMSAASLDDYLSDPMLLQEMVQKLPTQMMIEWSRFKRKVPGANLRTFSTYMSDLVSVSADVVIPEVGKPNKSNRQKLYYHHEQEMEGEKQNKPQDYIKRTCGYCSDTGHRIYQCEQFKALDIDGRWKAIKERQLCRICLAFHKRWPCRSNKDCGTDGCRSRHHHLLHDPAKMSNRNTESQEQVEHHNHHYTTSSSLFRYLPVVLEGNDKRVEIFAFLDDGSTATFLETSVAKELGIRGPEDSLSISWTGNISREEKGSQRISLSIGGTQLKSRFILNNVRTVQQLKLPRQSFQYEEMKRTYPHLRGLPIQSYVDAVPKMIVGLEHVKILAPLKIREGRGSDPVASKTRLGWCVYGKQAAEFSTVERLNVHKINDISNEELHRQIGQFFESEAVNTSRTLESESDKRAMQILKKSTKRIGDRFETSLLWRYDFPCFPESHYMAKKRLLGLERRLSKDPQLKQIVQDQVNDYVQKGYAHIATDDELKYTDPEKVWYLPLGVVRNPKKPEKVRLIWDASAKVNGVCFNDMLLKGPAMLTSLHTILLRFRQRNIGVSGDIKEMFHQVRIRAADKQSQRFLFRHDTNDSPQVYVMDVATFGATCSPCMAQYVKNHNAEEHASRYPDAVKAIIDLHYVDDYLESLDTPEEAVRRVNEIRYIHRKGGFEIRNFLSNSSDVLRQLGVQQHSSDKSLNLEPGVDNTEKTERVLGMLWKPTEDVFSFNTMVYDEIQNDDYQRSPTKRQVLRTIMRLFDPLGLVAHYIVHGKILMQEIWKFGSSWDEEIPVELLDKWNRWSRLLKNLNTVQVPRCFFSGINSDSLEDLQLHVFVDASEAAYAAVAYLRAIIDGEYFVSFVTAKTKVAPLKPLSIPRLELQAGVLGSRIAQYICSSLNLAIKKRVLWSDSMTVLAWLRSDSRRFHQYVAVRVGEILTCTTVDEWRYVPSKHNVADEATKWGIGPSFSYQNRWFTGPEFLKQHESAWPASSNPTNNTEEELRAIFLYHGVVPQSLFDLMAFSQWRPLLRRAAYFMRVVNRFHKKHQSGPLTSEEFKAAENLLWRQAQIDAYPNEYSALEESRETNSPIEIAKTSPLYKLSPYLDEYGVIRMNSRIGAAPITQFEAKYPIILPQQHRITKLIIDSYHRRYLHGNHETIVNEMRQKFYISGLRAQVRKVSAECQTCIIEKAKPRPPMMAPLPPARLTPFVKPFTFVGVDYFGPILVKQGRSLVKRWVALFTCLTVRAVHLEIAHSLTTSSCIMAFRRFIARRGSPAEIFSDNGTNFQGAKNILMDQLQQIHQVCAVTFTNSNTRWNFNPPAAPHMGGSWERLVRSIKLAMEGISKHPRNPCDEVLETVALEAEAIVNSRPLTYIPLETENSEALTPNHFLLYGERGITQPIRLVEPEGTVLRDSWKLARNLVDMFWNRWIREYLPTITRRTKWFTPVRPLKSGDLVLVVDENKRNGWIRGRILSVVKAGDGQVRKAYVKTINGESLKPVVKLALLDVKTTEGISSVGNPREGECSRGSPCMATVNDVSDLGGIYDDLETYSKQKKELS